MTIETKKIIETKVSVSINFTYSERITLQNAAALLLNVAYETEEISDEISDEISEKCTKAYDFLMGLIGLEG